jgi:hypothetical protein
LVDANPKRKVASASLNLLTEFSNLRRGLIVGAEVNDPADSCLFQEVGSRWGKLNAWHSGDEKFS